ncbi:uroporphyrinogen-III C-methyltransferase [Pseudohongiella sp. SYSU M77423]|uniref:uroporphyrinogen-III C-methyltransferase n=1 Tax=Pseudohongiella sp. SYSU M77423 TaxID=3042312 RepID=UPI00248007E5|nr:uroporphyrinogen-III C-methyltransferase [Pseudohongiella sp. SYSU M77423]MDH7944054.1 uroporphyrinogen-III C-methyltransferase [Pseudohongiella sp. SYSU M77423]
MLSLVQSDIHRVGEVWLVGAGPGDPELISVRGLRLIREADVLVYDRLVSPQLLEEARDDAVMLDVGKRPGFHRVPQHEIEALLVKHARRGCKVVRLKGGDPFIFGRGGEEMLTLRAAGIPVHVVPGITAAAACAAASGFPLTQRKVADSVCLTTAHHSDDGDDTDWASLAADPQRTLVFYMGLSSLQRIQKNLGSHGMSPDTPAALIENGSYAHQRTITCKLKEIEQMAKQHNLQTPCLLVVGKVITLAQQARAAVEQASHQVSRSKMALGRNVAAAMMLTTAPALAGAADSDSVAEALAQGSTSISFRARSEQVDDDALPRDAVANTLRTRLTYRSGSWQSLSLLVEVDNVSYLGDDSFNNTRNGMIMRPVIVDPDGTDLNQAALRLERDRLTVTAGRQRLLRENQRMIGGVGWRQNEQTYDAIDVAYKPAEQVQLNYAWVDDTQRIFGPESGVPAASLDSDHHILNARWTVSPAIDVAAYHIALDFDDAAALSSATTGLIVSGAFDARENLRLDYRAEVAQQTDAANNPASFDVNYHHAGLGLTHAGWRIGWAHESLGADSSAGVAMQTPLATLHAFQGWADKFLTTPTAGMRDNQFSVSGVVAGFALQLHHHDYQADVSGLDYGKEWNIQLGRAIGPRYTLTAKYARYTAEQFARDTSKFWLMAEARF